MGFDGIEHHAGGGAGGDGFLACEIGEVAFPTIGQLPSDVLVPLGGQIGISQAIIGEQRLPFRLTGRSCYLYQVESLLRSGWDVEALICRETKFFLGLADAIRAQG